MFSIGRMASAVGSGPRRNWLVRQGALLLRIRPIALQLLLHGLAAIWPYIVGAGSRLSERSLQDGGNLTRRGFLNVSLSAHLGNQRLVLDLIGRKTATKLV